MRRVRGGVLLGTVLLLAGCSQVSALAPVGGDRVTEVRYAANDLLLQNRVDVMTAPVCTMASDKSVTCEGETLDHQRIAVESTASDQSSLTVTVDGKLLATADIATVLEKAMQTS